MATNKHSYESGNAYLTNIISDGIYRWTFKIIDICDELNFGIWKTNSATKPDTVHRFFRDKDSGYAFEAKRGKLMDPSYFDYVELESYAKCCNNGDVVEMILNLEDYTLSFKVNDIDYGVAFKDIEKTEYRAAIFIYAYGYGNTAKVGCIELIE